MKLSTKEAAKIYGCSRQFIAKQIKDGKLKAKKVWVRGLMQWEIDSKDLDKKRRKRDEIR